MIKLSKIGGLGLLCAVASMLFGMQGAYAQSQTFGWEPEDPDPEGAEGYVDLGAGVAVCGRTAAVGASAFGPENPDTPEYDLLWQGLVNVYTTNAERTRWTLLTVLHADDALPENLEFGKAIAMYRNRLVIASNAALRIYERRLDTYALLDTVVFSDAISTPIQFEKDVLAVGVGSSVRVFRIGPYGNARQVASLSPAGALSLNANADTLAVGLEGVVHLYQPHGSTWTRSDIITAPSSTASGFGASVALSGSGKRLLVGAPYEDQQFLPLSILWRGAVHVYLHTNDRWVRVQRLASNDPAQPSYAMVGFGQEILMSGGYVWITAPHGNEQNASALDIGRSSLYRWNAAARLEFVAHGPNSWPEGGIDMTSRYVIEGDIWNGWGGQNYHREGAHITDLSPVVPISTVNNAATSPED